MKRKLMVLFLVAAMAVSTTACGSSGNGNEKKETVSDGGSAEIEELQEEVQEELEEEADSGNAVSVEEQVLAEWEEGVKITATGLEITDYSAGLNVSVENNSSHNIRVAFKDIYVNTCYMDSRGSLGSHIPAGEKVEESLDLAHSGNNTYLENLGLDPVGRIQFYIQLFDADVEKTDGRTEKLYESGTIEIQTSAYDEMDTEAFSEGTELYNQNGIRIVAKKLDDYSRVAYGVFLYVENTTDQQITLLSYNTSVNGVKQENRGSMELTIPSKNATGDCMMLWYDDKISDASALSEITSVEFGFQIYEGENSWAEDMIGDTGMLSYNPQDGK